MKMYFDTETTGLYGTRDFHRLEGKPAVMSYAHVLVDDDWNEVEEYHELVQIPEEVTIHPKAFEAHGICRADCREKGLPLSQVFGAFISAVARSRMVVGYNVQYDLDMMEISYWRIQEQTNGGLDKMELPQPVDLMRYSTPICQLPSTNGFRGFKWPKLSEALKIICDYEHVGAHNALADTKGCIRLHKKLVGLRNV